MSHWFRFGDDPFVVITFLRSLRHGADFRAALRAEKANVEPTQKVVPFITCEMSLGQNACELILGFDVPNLDLGV